MTENDVWIWTDHNGNTHEYNSRNEAMAAALDGEANPWARDDQGPEAA